MNRTAQVHQSVSFVVTAMTAISVMIASYFSISLIGMSTAQARWQREVGQGQSLFEMADVTPKYTGYALTFVSFAILTLSLHIRSLEKRLGTQDEAGNSGQ